MEEKPLSGHGDLQVRASTPRVLDGTPVTEVAQRFGVARQPEARPRLPAPAPAPLSRPACQNP